MKYPADTYVHVCARGSRGLEIVRDDHDRWHFLDLLYYVNHKEARRNLFRELRDVQKVEHSPQRFFWPTSWPPREPLVDVTCHSLVENHHHLLLRNRVDDGVPLFMQKFGIGFSKYYNEKYKTQGTLFQGRYHAKIVDADEYLAYVSIYIQVKNTLEVYPGGLQKALQEFDKALEWTIAYPFSSFGDYAGTRNSPIVEKGVLGEMFPSPESYRQFAHDCILGMNLEAKIGHLTLEKR